MDKLAKRVVQAERQVARRAARADRFEAAKQRKEGQEYAKKSVEELRSHSKKARQTLKETWELGPLAPVRDLGFNKYGAIAQPLRNEWSFGALPRNSLLEKRCAWAGGPKMLCLAPGDRIVIFEGPDRGKIDRIESIQNDLGTVKLKTYHKALVTVSLVNKTDTRPLNLPISAIRLVYPLRNPVTGEIKDRIINELKAISPNMKSPNMNYIRWNYGYKWDRVVPGINVVIPWPEVSAPKYEDIPADTPKNHVEQRTFNYHLTIPPMPEGVLDELRNKYSKFRTRHEDWYVAKKEQEAAGQEAKENMASTMRTPLDEFHEKQRKLRQEQGEPQLTHGMLLKIGRIMAKNKPDLLPSGGSSTSSLVAAPRSASAGKGSATTPSPAPPPPSSPRSRAQSTAAP